MKKFVAVALLFVASVAMAETPKELDTWRAASVMVTVPNASGSGVCFKNHGHLFVHTAGHVIAHAEKIETVINPATGQPKVIVKYEDVKVVREVYRDGRKVGERMAFAEVIRYSDAHNDDYALLHVYDPNFVSRGVEFSTHIPKPGDEIWHVGSSKGTKGQNSVTKGVFSTAGRLRRDCTVNETDHPLIYDQVNLPAMPGSSGCGIFEAKTGTCIGLLTEGMEGSECLNFVVPTRRIRTLAKKYNFLWALDDNVPVPEKLVGKSIRLTNIPLPDEWKKPQPAPPPAVLPPPVGSLIPIPFPFGGLMPKLPH